MGFSAGGLISGLGGDLIAANSFLRHDRLLALQ